MKREFVKVCLMAVLAAGSIGTSVMAEQQSSLEKHVEEAPDIAAMVETNMVDTLLERHETITINDIYHAEDTGILSIFQEFTADSYVREDSNGEVDIIKDGEAYGFQAAENLPYRVLFDEAGYEEYWNYYWADRGLISYVEEEVLELVGTEDGFMTLESSLPVSYADTLMGEEYKKTLTEEDVLITQYIADEKTYEMQSLACYIENGAGERTMISETHFRYDEEPYQATEELETAVFDENGRTVTVIADYGTEQQTEYVQTVGRPGAVWLFTKYEQYYTDAACTQVYDMENEDYESDMTLYVKQEDAMPAQ